MSNTDLSKKELTPETPPERCAAKFRFSWRVEQLPIICLNPNGEKKRCPKLIPKLQQIELPSR